MPLPILTPGLVVRYEYLWHRRAASSTADKDHPACIIATFRHDGVAGDFVVYLPLSHSPPSQGEEGIELPDEVKRRAGLDPARQWVLISECNLDAWPYDLRQLPHEPGRFHYGHLPPGMFNIVRDRFVERWRAGTISKVNRTAP